jgi:hypothetical protein
MSVQMSVSKNVSGNIFKTVSKKTDKVCLELAKKCFQKCFFDKNDFNNIIKYFTNDENYEWEIKVYSYLLHKNITLLSSSRDKKICYQTGGTVCLFDFLKKGDDNLLLNEMFSFVNNFSKIGFVHGNMHICNIFVDIKTLRFYIIDFSNSYIIDQVPDYKRISCSHDFLLSWDMYNLYVSLKDFYKNEYKGKLCVQSKLDYLENIISIYIKSDVLKILQDESVVIYSNYTNSRFLSVESG